MPIRSHVFCLTSTLTAVACATLATWGADAVAATRAVTPASAHKTVPALTLKPRIVPTASNDTLRVGLTIPGFPHKVDVYQPAGATKAIVFLHGHGGRSAQMAHDIGLNSLMAPPTLKTVNWAWLQRNGIIAVFPQGQAKPGGQPTWSNYVFNSGQDDVAFLNALSAYVKTQYGATEVSLAGHSAGGVMTGRMWCEATTSYKAFVSLAGPMVSSSYPMPGLPCTPLAPAPYYAIIGGSDQSLAQFTGGYTTPTPEQVAAGLTNTILTSEWLRHVGRSTAVCGDEQQLSGAAVASTGPTWNACSTHIRYSVVNGADHPIASLSQHAGIDMVDAIAAFVK